MILKGRTMMMNKMMLLATCTLLATNLFAQEVSKEQQVVYKWYENGIAHYAKTPPRGNDNYIRINQYGMVIKDRPNVDSFQVIKPIRPEVSEVSNGEMTMTENTEEPAAEEMPEGAISKDERCEMMEDELTALNTKEDIYQEDESGNLIPLDNTEVEQRKQELKDALTRLCDS